MSWHGVKVCIYMVERKSRESSLLRVPQAMGTQEAWQSLLVVLTFPAAKGDIVRKIPDVAMVLLVCTRSRLMFHP